MTRKHVPLETVSIKPDGEKIALSGDWHGHVQRGAEVIAAAKRNEASIVIVLGDFGYWEHTPKGIKDLDSISKVAGQAGVMVKFLDGNHDNHPLLWEKYKNSPRDRWGFWEVRPNLHYIPRGHRWTMGTTSFLALGGANSTDKEWRLERENRFTFNEYHQRQKPLGPGTLWWPTEDITEEDISKAIDGPRVEVLLTHDAPSGIEVPERKDQPESLESREKVRRVLDLVEAQYLFHGHFHIRKSSEIQTGKHHVKVTGLADNRHSVESQVLIIEV